MLPLSSCWPCRGGVFDLYFSTPLRNNSSIFLKAFIRAGCWILPNTILHFSGENTCGGECISRFKGGILSMWFPNVRLSFFLWNPRCFFYDQNALFSPQEAALILSICKKPWFLIGIFGVPFWKGGLTPLDLFYKREFPLVEAMGGSWSVYF